MTARILLLLLLTATVARSTDVTLVLDGVNGKAPFRLGSVYPGIRAGSFYRPELLRYYISQITIHHDGEKHTPLPDTYILVDVKEVQRYSLGDLDVGSVDSITFFIGVDKDRNHLDPTTYPEWHPLALKTPSMHWGWAAGYRFVTYEGMAGTSESKLTAGFQIHTLDDALYTRVACAASSTRTAVGLDVPLRADYGRLLETIDVSKGLIMHGSTDEAITLMRNMGSAVYSPGITTSVEADDERTSSLAPNPATDVVQLQTDVVEVRISDMSSATVLSASITAGSPLLSVSTLPNGTYSVILRRADGSIRHELLVIVR
ncbi:MAG: hypothetical protein FGM32_04880 [Candidatus Kapabacteria bacterium]|nr:hypothetical protein [Candidatus Kapabacteria bacterium]